MNHDSLITPWFSDPRFVEAVIRGGLGVVMRDGTSNNDGIALYLVDDMSRNDGAAIAALVSEHNKRAAENKDA